jgi:hypothetical protein
MVNFILHMHRIQSGDMLSLNHCHPRRRGCSSEHQDKLKFGIKQKYLIRRRRRGILCRCRMWWPRGVGRRPRSWRGVRRDWAVRGGQGNAPALSYCSGSAEAWSCYPAGTTASHCCPAAAAPSHIFPRRGVGHGDRWWRIDGARAGAILNKKKIQLWDAIVRGVGIVLPWIWDRGLQTFHPLAYSSAAEYSPSNLFAKRTWKEWLG